MRSPVTITVRTPLTSNILLPAGHTTVRSPFTARTFLFPFTAYRSISVSDDTIPAGPPTIVGRTTGAGVVTALFVVVEVSPLVVVMNPANGLPGLINAWSERFAEDPIDDTTAPDTFTESDTKFTRAVGAQSVPCIPVQLNSDMIPSFSILSPKNALLIVGPRFVSQRRVYCVAHLKSVILLVLFDVTERYGLQSLYACNSASYAARNAGFVGGDHGFRGLVRGSTGI